MNHSYRLSKTALLALALCGALLISHVAFAVTTIIEEPLLLLPEAPEGEKLFHAQQSDIVAGRRTWDFRLKGGIVNYATTQSVGDGVGMIVYAPPGATGYLMNEDAGASAENLAEFKGICFWLKGDGSDAKGVLGWDYDFVDQWSFPLKNKEWHKVFVEWKDFGKDFKGQKYINVSMEREDTSKANWYIIDRMHFFKTKNIEKITPTPNKDPKGDIKALQFVSGRENISKTLAKLKAKEKVTIVIIGDSITAAAQLWYVPKPHYDYAYPVLAANALAEKFGYEKANILYDSYVHGAWKRVVGEGATIGDGLNIVVLGAGGKNTKFGVSTLDKVLAFQPDMVHNQYGCNDIPWGTAENYANQTNTLVDRLLSEGVEVSLGTPTSNCGLAPLDWLHNQSIWEKGLPHCEMTRQIVESKKCALVDMRKGFDARGPHFIGDLYSDQYHPNHRGHRIMGKLLQILFTEEDLTIWSDVPDPGMFK